ncbi:MAG: ABC transporter [Ruminococcaceae bacterium]|nr:ABC transporter [Oscillospiraceae bacterium]
MFAIYQKELKSYFNNLFGYLYIAIILFFMGLFTSIISFKQTYSDLALSFDYLSLVVLLVTPLLTMRSIAEERQKKTDQLLYSLPVSVSSVVIAKYLALLTVFAIPMAVICLYPFVLSSFGMINFARTFGYILSFFLMGACLLAIGLFISSLTENQIISAVISFVAMLIIYFSSALASLVPATSQSSFVAFTVMAILFGVIVYVMVKNYVIALGASAVCEVTLALLFSKNQTMFEGLFGKVIGWISVYERCYNFYMGIFDLTAVVYFLSVIFLFVFLTVQSVEKRRWS